MQSKVTIKFDVRARQCEQFSKGFVMHLRYLILLVAALATTIGCNCCGYSPCCSAPMECTSCCGGEVIYEGSPVYSSGGSSCSSCQASAGAVYGAPVATSSCANGQCNANRAAAPGPYTTHYAGQYYNGAQQPRSGCPNGQCNGGGGGTTAAPTPTPSPAAASGGGETVDDFLPSVLSN